MKNIFKKVLSYIVPILLLGIAIFVFSLFRLNLNGNILIYQNKGVVTYIDDDHAMLRPECMITSPIYDYWVESKLILKDSTDHNLYSIRMSVRLDVRKIIDNNDFEYHLYTDELYKHVISEEIQMSLLKILQENKLITLSQINGNIRFILSELNMSSNEYNVSYLSIDKLNK